MQWAENSQPRKNIMADPIDNRLIAAHLAAAMISGRPMPEPEAVKIYNTVLAVLNSQSKSEKETRAAKMNEGIKDVNKRLR
jgi:hypothetical protein